MLPVMRTILSLTILLLFGFIPATAADVSGKWTFTLEISGVGTYTPAFEFKQDGEKLSGKYTGGLGTHDIAGTVKGNAIEFSFKGELNGDPIAVTYIGTIESDTKMKGTSKLGDMGEGTWTGEKDK